jgi:hypothetical protein
MDVIPGLLKVSLVACGRLGATANSSRWIHPGNFGLESGAGYARSIRQFRHSGPTVCAAELFSSVEKGGDWTGFTGRGKTQNIVILSEAKNLSVFFSYASNEERFFASLRMTNRALLPQAVKP